MPGARKSWTQKLKDSKDLPRVEIITEKMSQRWGTGTVVIPAPLEVDALMRSVPRGQVTTINQIREALARRHNATIGCPITTGIFAWVAAHAADEMAICGDKNITPYWRTLKAGGELNAKYPGGVQEQAARLKEEGHIIEQSKKVFRVKDFAKKLAQLSP